MEKMGCWSRTWMLTMGVTINQQGLHPKYLPAPQSFSSFPILPILVQKRVSDRRA